MASVYRRGKRWWVGFTDAAGVRRNESTKVRTRDEAKKLAAELETKHERIKRGLEVEPGDPRLTWRELVETWWKAHGSRLANSSKAQALRKHTLPALGDLVLREVTPARLELLFDQVEKTLTGSSVNTLRASVRAVFGWAESRGLWLGENPAKATTKRKELQHERDELAAEEIPLVLEQVAPRFRALVATAIGTGGRKGDLGGLRVEDVDLNAGAVRFARSWARETTKAGTSMTVPIAAWLKPYLVEALGRAKALGSELVFPAPDGSMMRTDVKLAPMLRRAMARAGMTRGWQHVCRRRGDNACDFSERRDHNRVEPCPKCGFRLWPKPIHRSMRWHDLRGTTATLLALSGASPAVAGRVLRHSDPKLTLKVYTRVRAKDMRQALEAMVPNMAPPPAIEHQVPAQAAAAVNAGPPAAAAPPLQPDQAYTDARTSASQTSALLSTSTALPARFERAASSFGEVPGVVGAAVRGGAPRSVQVLFRGIGPVGANATERHGTRFLASDAAPPLQSPVLGLNLRKPEIARQLLTVRQVAEQLAVSTSTVYALCELGDLEHVRVSNAIRIEPAALKRYLDGRRS